MSQTKNTIIPDFSSDEMYELIFHSFHETKFNMAKSRLYEKLCAEKYCHPKLTKLDKMKIETICLRKLKFDDVDIKKLLEPLNKYREYRKNINENWDDDDENVYGCERSNYRVEIKDNDFDTYIKEIRKLYDYITRPLTFSPKVRPF